jgi:hypothetical protein
MRKEFLQPVKATFPAITGVLLMFFFSSASGQQYVIAQKDVTRPESSVNSSVPAFITSFTAIQMNGYNEISWATTHQQDTRKFIVEYSVDGVNYLSAAETLADRNSYTVKHQIADSRPLIYRIRMEQLTGRYYNTPPFFLDGDAVLPIKIYPTIITGNTVNIRAAWPVERIAIYAGNGAQVMVKEIGGLDASMTIVLPSLARGDYWMTFIGRGGWKITEKFIIQ